MVSINCQLDTTQEIPWEKNGHLSMPGGDYLDHVKRYGETHLNCKWDHFLGRGILF